MIKIEIPILPISVNQAFATNWKTHLRFKTADYQKFRQAVFLYTPEIRIEDRLDKLDVLKVGIEIHRNWYTKQGYLKKVDIANYEKCLIDPLFEKLELDDSQIFDINMKKVQSDKEKTVVTIEPLTHEKDMVI